MNASSNNEIINNAANNNEPALIDAWVEDEPIPHPSKEELEEIAASIADHMESAMENWYPEEGCLDKQCEGETDRLSFSGSFSFWVGYKYDTIGDWLAGPSYVHEVVDTIVSDVEVRIDHVEDCAYGITLELTPEEKKFVSREAAEWFKGAH